MPKGLKVNLAKVKKCLTTNKDGSRCLDMCNQGLLAVPKWLLSLDDEKLKKLNLCYVEELNLSRNRLTKLPDFFNQFFKLRVLDLHSNQLESIPESIGSLQDLLDLNLCNNHLTTDSLPSELGLLGNLRKLNLGFNRLATVPRFFASLRQLRWIGLFDNELTSYPECLRKLEHLETVNMSGNPVPPPPEVPADAEVIPEVIPEVDIWELERKTKCLYCPGCLAREAAEEEDQAQQEAVKTKRMFAVLATPNSVARENQMEWRCRPNTVHD